MLVFAVSSLSPQVCDVESTALLTSRLPARHSAGASPAQYGPDAQVLLDGVQSKGATPRADSPATDLVLAGITPLLHGSANTAFGRAACPQPASWPAHSGRAPPRTPFL